MKHNFSSVQISTEPTLIRNLNDFQKKWKNRNRKSIDKTNDDLYGMIDEPHIFITEQD